MNLEEFTVKVQQEMSAHPYLREGQALFNILYAEEPSWADEIRATELDPFYNDNKIPVFWAWLAQKLLDSTETSL